MDGATQRDQGLSIVDETHNMHMVFSVFHICHVPVYGLIEYDNSFSSPTQHVVLHLEHNISIDETRLYHRTLSHLCASDNSWAWYSRSYHFLLITCLIKLPLSITILLHDTFEIFFSNFHAGLTLALWVSYCMPIYAPYHLEIVI